ncbi:MAG: FMN-dependent NADH-azoreductase [Pseudohongiellaceae bacterium]|jgi:FMN-dependent NADH-azoreductase
MTHALRLTTSILGENSVSTHLLDKLETQLRAQGDDLTVTHRDFSVEPIPHFDSDWLGAVMTPESERTDEQQRKADFSDRLISELRDADVLMIGLPMYNFTVPSMLKAWNDHVARAGNTFEYTAAGPQGLLADKPVFLVSAMGGIHKEGESDFLRPYMKQFLGLLGITDIRFITASGLNLGEEPRATAIAAAEAEINNAVSSYRKATQTEERAA